MQNAILKQNESPKPVLEDVGGEAVAEIPPGIAEVQTATTQRTARIHELLNNMDENGAALANFEPLDHPVIQHRVDHDLQKQYETTALQIPTSNLRISSETPFHPSFSSSSGSNYHQMYESPIYPFPSPSPSLHRSNSFPNNERWMEKMNYIIYLLEQQQNEKTNHITEEFVLYTFLGVFVIFVVDAFSRGGKYIR